MSVVAETEVFLYVLVTYINDGRNYFKMKLLLHCTVVVIFSLNVCNGSVVI